MSDLTMQDCLRLIWLRQSPFSLSEITVGGRDFCEFVRFAFFYAKSLAKRAELYYNITVLFFAADRKNGYAVWLSGTVRRNGLDEEHDTENRF